MNQKVIVISPGNYSFVENDVLILKEKFEVETYILPQKKGFGALTELIKLAWYLLKNNSQVRFTYVWFADYHSFVVGLVSYLFKKKMFLIIGGYDAAKITELGYGAHVSKIRSLMVKWSCQLSTKFYPVSKSTQAHLVRNLQMNLTYKSKVIYNLVNTNFFRFDSSIEKQNLIICVSSASNHRTMKVKGIDFYAKVAKNMPEFEFLLVGVKGEVQSYIENLAIPNLKIYSFLPKEELVGLLQKSKVICQFSLYESFGVALAEGMLMGCIPIAIVNLGAAEVVDEIAGLTIKNQNLDEASQAIRKAIEMSEDYAESNVRRVKNNFSLEIRKNLILSELANI